MKTKITNAIIVQNFDTKPIYGDIVIEDDKIVFVGENFDKQTDKVIDAKDNIVMPGFVDAHTHGAMTLLKGIASGEKLENWLASMQRLEKQMTGQDVYYGTMLACMEFAKNGITTVNDNYHFVHRQRLHHL